jgi:hypothetical protein
MTRTKAAAAAPVAPLELKAQAIRRVQARRRPAKYAEMPNGLGGTTKWQLDSGGEFTPAETIGEWVDDRIARCPVADGPCNVLIHLFDRLRGGADAVPDAVAFAASQLRDDYQRFAVFGALNSTPGGGAEIDAVKTTLMREWQRRGLPVQPGPRAPFGRDPMDLNSPRPGNIEYRTPYGHNAA